MPEDRAERRARVDGEESPDDDEGYDILKVIHAASKGWKMEERG